ncbi:hypothetical protein ACFSFZ_04730 [Mixta tenebrionis]|uniref:DUF1496 domain-containing protein n=1 Tax=Mixta tenebrionis TaxID=2562439 RepID=A0A506V6U5_9GAMM|nr:MULTISPECIES: hypothetical protein [Mixta]QHM76429.1 hypothetical protein C7M52_02405 [Mixta theicola]TPW41388.1 hypothetical protein FKM52_14150 [Mixta tenebrionis]
MKYFTKCVPLLLFFGLAARAGAETVAVSLSQEQDGGAQGRACIYVYQGKAEFRTVKAGESCQPEILLETHEG